MRALLILTLLMFPGLAVADPGDHYVLDQNQALPIIQPLQKRLRSSREKPLLADGFDVEIYGRGLGRIAAMAAAPEGQIYTSDPDSNRVFELVDRGRDGRRDFKQVILDQRDHPTGLAVMDEALFIADRNAIWRWDRQSRNLSRLADLSKMAASGDRPLLARPRDNAVWIALNTGPQTAKIISVDIESGQAELISETAGPVTALTASPASDVWAAAGNRLIRVTSAPGAQNMIEVEAGSEISGLLMLGDRAQQAGFGVWKDHLLVAQGGVSKLPQTTSGGMNIIAVPTIFGQPKTEMTVWMDGFQARNRRSYWGLPGALLLNAQGMFIADPVGGIIWKASPAPKAPEPVIQNKAKDIVKPAAEEKPKTKPKTEPQEMIVSTMKGSQIERASSLDVGSTILKDWEEAQKARDDESADENAED